MSIAVLTQVYDEVRRLAIAGSVVAPGDFRLKKLVPPLDKAGEKAPVFAKVAGSATKLIESDEKSSAEALLELSTLVNAILYTQGETGITGELCSIEMTNVGGHHTRTAARVLKPVLEALTNTGSGRLEVIRDAFERGVFNDLRLVKPALTAIDDPYPEIGDLIAEKVLPPYGRAVLPELRAKLDIKGKGGHPRRLALMHRIDPEGTGPLVKEALENGSKEMKVVAIECLGTWPEPLLSLLRPLNYLLEQAKAKAKEVRAAALKALAKIDENEAIAAFETALISDDIQLAVRAIQESPNRKLLQTVLTGADEQFSELLAGNEKDKKTLNKQIERMLALLECLRGKKDKAVETFLLKCFAARDKVSVIQAELTGKDVQERLISIMVQGSEKTQSAVVDAHASLEAHDLAQAFVAACQSRPAKDVFLLFRPYLNADFDEKNTAKKSMRPDSPQAKMEVIVRELVHCSLHNRFNSDECDNSLVSLDPRWLDVAIALCRKKKTLELQGSSSATGPLELLLFLARPGHAEANQLLTEVFDDWINKPKDLWEYSRILQTMVRVQHPAATDAMIRTIEKHAKGNQVHSLGLVGEFIPQLPKDAVPRFETLLQSLPEKAIDQLLEPVTQLKNRP